jgi:O-succinylbenzoate synthase
MTKSALADSRFSTLWRDATVFRLPLKTKFRGIKSREGVLFQGEYGWGEFAPFHDHDDEHAAMWLKASIEMAFSRPISVAANCVRVNSIVPDCEVDQAVTWALTGGCEVAKVKVSGSAITRRQDLDRLHAVSKALGVGSKLRVDLNGALSLDQAIEFVQDCQGLPIDYFEQPCKSVEDCGELRKRTGARVALDESIRLGSDRSHDGFAQIRSNADVAVLKPIPLGGFASTKLVSERLQMPCVISSSLDTSVGLAYAARIAATIAPGGMHGLGTASLFDFDVARHALLAHQGEIHIGAVEPDTANLERASDGTKGAIETKWHDRMARCWALLSKDPVLDLVSI